MKKRTAAKRARAAEEAAIWARAADARGAEAPEEEELSPPWKRLHKVIRLLRTNPFPKLKGRQLAEKWADAFQPTAQVLDKELKALPETREKVEALCTLKDCNLYRAAVRLPPESFIDWLLSREMRIFFDSFDKQWWKEKPLQVTELWAVAGPEIAEAEEERQAEEWERDYRQDDGKRAEDWAIAAVRNALRTDGFHPLLLPRHAPHILAEELAPLRCAPVNEVAFILRRAARRGMLEVKMFEGVEGFAIPAAHEAAGRAAQVPSAASEEQGGVIDAGPTAPRQKVKKSRGPANDPREDEKLVADCGSSGLTKSEFEKKRGLETGEILRAVDRIRARQRYRRRGE
jgi:hypothetical protein